MPSTATNRRRIRVPLALAIATLVGGCNEFQAPPKPPAQTPGPRAVEALGSLEPAGGVIAISATPGDRLKRLGAAIKLNQRVPAGGVLGVMASYDARLAQRQALLTKREMTAEKHRLEQEAADARVEAASARLAQATAKRTEVVSQAKRLSYLEEAAAIAASDFAQLNRLVADDPELITPSQLRRKANQVDRAKKDFQIARETHAAALNAAKTAVTAAERSLASARRSRRVLASLEPVRVVDEEIRLAEQSLIQSLLLAPGVDPGSVDPINLPLDPTTNSPPGRHTVLRVYLQPGEAVRQTPVLEIGDLSSMVCVAEVLGEEAKLVTPGQKATITSPAFSGDYEGKAIAGVVESIAQVVGNPGLMDRNPLAPVDRRVVEVRIAIDPADAGATAEAGRWIGMQVDVRFEIEPPAEPPEEANLKNPAP